MVPRSNGPKVQESQGPKDQDISKSYSNTSLTLKKVHLVVTVVKKAPQILPYSIVNIRQHRIKQVGALKTRINNQNHTTIEFWQKRVYS